VGWLQALAAEIPITLADGTVWLSIGQALLFGAVLMLFARPKYKGFFNRKPEVYNPATAGQALLPEEEVVA